MNRHIRLPGVEGGRPPDKRTGPLPGTRGGLRAGVRATLARSLGTPVTAGGRPRIRIITLAGVALAVGVSVVAGCTLIAPGLVLGAESPAVSAAPLVSVPDPDVRLSAGTLLVTLPWGEGKGEVGLARPTEGLVRGPEALAVASDGSIAVLDSVNRRVLLLDPSGSPVGTVEIPLSEPRFLAVDDGRVYVLDCDSDRQVATLDQAGALVGIVALPELPDVVTGFFATEAGLCVEVAHDSVFLLANDLNVTGLEDPGREMVGLPDSTRRASPGKVSLTPVAGRPLDRALSQAVKVTFAPATGLRIQSIKINRAGLKAKKMSDSAPPLAPGRKVDYLVSVDGDGSDGLIIGARLLDGEPADGTRVPGGGSRCLFLTKFAVDDRGHRPTGSLLLTESSFAYLGQPYVVAPDGRVFQPVADESGYSILVHSFAGMEAQAIAEEVLP